MFYHTLLNVSL